MKMTRKWLALLMAAMMVVILLPTTAFAADTEMELKDSSNKTYATFATSIDNATSGNNKLTIKVYVNNVLKVTETDRMFEKSTLQKVNVTAGTGYTVGTVEYTYYTGKWNSQTGVYEYVGHTSTVTLDGKKSSKLDLNAGDYTKTPVLSINLTEKDTTTYPIRFYLEGVYGTQNYEFEDDYARLDAYLASRFAYVGTAAGVSGMLASTLTGNDQVQGWLTDHSVTAPVSISAVKTSLEYLKGKGYIFDDTVVCTGTDASGNAYNDTLATVIAHPEKYALVYTQVSNNHDKITYKSGNWHYNGSDIYQYSYHVHLKLVRTDVKYTATYVFAGTVPAGAVAPAAETHSAGEALTRPTDPYVEGYTFDGWYTSNTEFTDTTRWNYTSGRITGNMTLYGKFTQKSYAVTFDPDGGAQSGTIATNMDNQTVLHGATATAPSPAPAKTGWTFDHWAAYTTDGEGNKTVESAAFDFATQIKHDTDLIAVYTKDSYAIRYYLDGVEQTDLKKTYEYGAAVTAATLPAKEGYAVTGWYSDEACTTPATVVTAMPAQNLAYYAKSAVNSYDYTVNYYVDGTKNTTLTETGSAAYNSTISYPSTAAPDKTPTGYKLSGTVAALTIGTGENVMNVYYVKDSFAYTVNYYVDGTKNTTLTETGSAAFGSTISYPSTAAPDKTPTGYKLSGTVADLTIGAGENVMNVYYVKDSFSYTVNYYKGSVGAANLLTSVTGSAVFGSEIPYVTGSTLPNGVAFPTGYATPGTATGQFTVTAVAANNVINVVYTALTPHAVTYAWKDSTATRPEGTALPGADTVYDGEDYTVKAGLTTTSTANGALKGTWTFDGWYNGTEKVTELTNVTADVALTGSWSFQENAKYGVTYAYVSADTTPLPSAIGPLSGVYAIGDTATYYVDETVTRKAQTNTAYSVTDSDGVVTGTWTLTGWDKDSAAMTASGVTFTGTWTYAAAKSYTVAYAYTGLPTGATATPPAATDGHLAGATVTLDQPAATSLNIDHTIYTFQGWTVTNVTGLVPTGAKGSETLAMPAQNVTVTGSWTSAPEPAYSYTINYYKDSDDGSAAVAEGNNFLGTATVGGKYLNDTVTLTSAQLDAQKPANYKTGVASPETLTITATDSANLITVIYSTMDQFTVTYQWATGTEAPAGAVLPTGETVFDGGSHTVAAAPATTVTTDALGRAGSWAFNGWDKTGTLTITANTVITGSWTFTPTPFTVTYSYVGTAGTDYPTGAAALPTEPNHFQNDTVTVAGKPADVRDDANHLTWKFLGWQNGTTSLGTSFTMPAANVTITGAWTKVLDGQYAVTYKFTGSVPSGQTVPDAANYYADDAVTPAAAPAPGASVKIGHITYTFDKWALPAGLALDEDGTFAMPDTAVEITGNWTAVEDAKYTVTYVLDNNPGNSFTAPTDSREYYAGDAVTVAARMSSYRVSGGTWYFSGWDHSNGFAMPAGDVTIHGSWRYVEDDEPYYPPDDPDDEPTIIEDEDVPLAPNPDSGDHSVVGLAAALAALAGLSGAVLSLRKRKTK